MTSLFERGELREFLHQRLQDLARQIEGLSEDEVLPDPRTTSWRSTPPPPPSGCQSLATTR